MEITRQHLIIQSQHMHGGPWDHMGYKQEEPASVIVGTLYYLFKAHGNWAKLIRTGIKLTKNWKKIDMNPMTSDKNEYKALHLVQSSCLHKYRVRINSPVNSSAEKNLQVMVNSKLNMSQQCSSKEEAILGCITKTAASKPGKFILPHSLETASGMLCPVLVSSVREK